MSFSQVVEFLKGGSPLWALAITQTTPDASEIVLAENMFNDPPEPGTQFYMVLVEAKYLGSGSSEIGSDLDFSTLGQSGVAYKTFDPGCGVIPDELPVYTEVFSGGSVQGWLCWQVSSDDADSLLVFVDEFLGTNRVWFDLKMDPTAAAEPTTIPVPTAVPEQTSPTTPPPLGSQTNPVSFSQVVEFLKGGSPLWALAITQTTPDASEIVLAENMFNDPPEPGTQFYMVLVEAKYLGSGSSEIGSDLDFSTLGQSGVAYKTFDPGCGVIPDELPVYTEVFSGGSVQGWLCWQVSSDDADSLLVFVDEFLGTNRVWFDLK